MSKLQFVYVSDMAPVVHGQWKHNADGTVECSVCHMPLMKTRITDANGSMNFIYITTNYCPHCGAKMDWRADDGEIQNGT